MKFLAYLLFCVVFYNSVARFVDPFLLMVGSILSLYLAIPCLIVVVAVVVHECVTGRRTSRRALALAIGILGLIAILWLAIPSNAFYANRAEAIAKAYPDEIAHHLESYRATHGHYPTSLSELPEKPSIPRLMHFPYGYRSDGNTYYFSFPKPGGLIDSWHYSSEYHTWRLLD